MGSLVITPQARYFLAISIGKMTWDGTDYFVISPASPIGQVLKGTQAGESISFQKRTITISEVI
ncbi:MAG TPA: hypothetical protein DCR93_26445 [Cytophagales bacterium]|nr:hypothetical protein [Cytophagales bacterium]